MILTALSARTASAQPADGAQIYTRNGCAACHGPTGAESTVPIYPSLAGQSEAYLLAQMKDIKSGARKNGLTLVMTPMISQVSDQELAAMAKWLSEQQCK